MRRKVNRKCNFRRAGLFQDSDVRIGPDNFRAVSAIQLLNTLTWIAGDLAERIHCMGKHARKHLHAVIGCAGLIGPLVAPAADYRSELFRAIELGNAKIAEILSNPISPW